MPLVPCRSANEQTRTFIVFGLLVLVLAVLIPWLAFRSDGDADARRPEGAGRPESGQSLFQINCGTCHTLYAAGHRRQLRARPRRTAGARRAAGRPDAADTIEATEGRVLNAVEDGVDSTTTPGRMPGGILNEEQAEEVAEFVARTAGEG